MRTLITIDFLKVNGINPERKDLDRNQILQSLEKLNDDICIALLKEFKRKKIEAKIVHVSE